MTLSVRILSFDEVFERLRSLEKPYHADYYAMYSSWYGGIVNDPVLMSIPVDDHLVHRGDGIFEAFKCEAGKVYGMHRHLDRLDRSSLAAELPVPMDRETLVETILATLRASGRPDAIIKLLISRGPGGFSASPLECPEAMVYVVVSRLSKPGPGKYALGVSLGSSSVPMKKGTFANIKSCNYLSNVLMKKEAEKSGLDFTVSIDENGFLGEGPTENVGIVTRDREFFVPRFDRILKGTTITRMMELVRPLIASGELTAVGEADITPEQARNAAEMMMFGTSFDALPVTLYDGQPIGDGKPGPLFQRFYQLMRDDIASGPPEMVTPVWE